MRKVEATNQAFQCKRAWKVLTDNRGRWVQAMKAKYLQHFSFMHYQLKTTVSLVWKGVTRSKGLLKSGLVWVIGDGRCTSF